VTRRGPDREAGAPPGLVIHDQRSARDGLRVLSRLDPELRARLVVIVANAGRDHDYGVTVRSDKLIAGNQTRRVRSCDR
jgi:hypothetical protein